MANPTMNFDVRGAWRFACKREVAAVLLAFAPKRWRPRGIAWELVRVEGVKRPTLEIRARLIFGADVPQGWEVSWF